MIATPSTIPPVVIVAFTVPTNAFDVSATVPVYDATVLLLASWAVTRTLNPVPAVFDAAESSVVPPDIVTRNLLAVPATNWTVAVSVRGEPFSLPLTLAVPTVAAEVSVALYEPLLLFVKPPNEPRFVARTTDPPLAIRLFPLPSFS